MSRKQATEARRRFSIETELRRALDKDQLKLFYQPLINLKTGEVAGFEALARWDHEDRGEISPTEFIPVAEEIGPDPPARPLGDGHGRADAGRLGPGGWREAAALRRRQPVGDPGRARQYRRRRCKRAAVERARPATA